MRIKFRKVMAIILSIALLVQTVPIHVFANTDTPSTEDSASEKTFSDVKNDDWFYDYVQYAYRNKLFEGTSNTNFTPYGNMTRGMYVTVIGRMVGIDMADYPVITFKDVAQDAYYASYVAWAFEKGITFGTSEQTFSPDVHITREQLATMTVRLFETMGWQLPKAEEKSAPKDFDEVSDYAKESVLALWYAGLLQGDQNGYFNPKDSATRAEVAAITVRALEYLVSEGILKEVTEEDDSDNGNSSGGNNGVIPKVQYDVSFDVITEDKALNATLPDDGKFSKGMEIGNISTPTVTDMVFLGWYYDETGTQPAEADDTINKNMTLYADFAVLGNSTEVLDAVPNELAYSDLETDFTFDVFAESEQAIRDKIQFIDSKSDEDMAYTIKSKGNSIFTITPQGAMTNGTYVATLPTDDESIYFYVEKIEEVQLKEIEKLTFLTKFEAIDNLSLDESIKYLRINEVSGFDLEAASGIVKADMNESGTTTTENTTSGTFTYTGDDIKLFDVVSIYEGVNPTDRTMTYGIQDKVAYVKITEIDGDTYTYEVAEMEEVIALPDVVPFPIDEDTDGKDNNDAITVNSALLDFSDGRYADYGVDSNAVLEEDDFLVFYTGDLKDFDPEKTTPTIVKITSVKPNADNSETTIFYEESDIEALKKDMSMVQEAPHMVELSEEDLNLAREEIIEQAKSSTFQEVTTRQMMELAFETDSMKELIKGYEKEDFLLQMSDGSYKSLALVDFATDDFPINLTVDVELSDDPQVLRGDGLRAKLLVETKVELSLPQYSANVVIYLRSEFTQELQISPSLDVSVRTFAGIFPTGVYFNASLVIGTYTKIDLDAVAYNVDNDINAQGLVDMFTGENNLDNIAEIGQDLKALMEDEEFFRGTNNGELYEIYTDFMEHSEAGKNRSFTTIYEVLITKFKGNIDKFGIGKYILELYLTASASMHVAIGTSFDYKAQKKYEYTYDTDTAYHNPEKPWDKSQGIAKVTNIVTPEYNFNFYVMGFIGMRVGFVIDFSLAFISAKLVQTGFPIEVGVLLELYGYFYYAAKWREGTEPVYQSVGAYYGDLSMYLIVFARTVALGHFESAGILYYEEWEFFSFGTEYAPYYMYMDDGNVRTGSAKGHFSVTEEPDADGVARTTNLEVHARYGSLYRNGSEWLEVSDDPNSYTVTFSDPDFSYDNETRTLSVQTYKGEGSQICDMRIDFKGNDELAPMNTTIKMRWSDVYGFAYLNEKYVSDTHYRLEDTSKFLGDMEYNKPLPEYVLDLIKAKGNPQLQGYEFLGWYYGSYNLLRRDYVLHGPFDPDTFIMPKESVYIIPHYRALSHDIKINYYKPTIRGDVDPANQQYELLETDILSFKTGEEVSDIVMAVRRNFTVNAAKEENKEFYEGLRAGIVESSVPGITHLSGSPIVEFNMYALWKYNFVTVDLGQFQEPNVFYQGQYQLLNYGEEFTYSSMNFSRLVDGYHCTGFVQTDEHGNELVPRQVYPLDYVFTMGEDRIYLTALWEPDTNTQYTVEHYVEAFSENGYYRYGDPIRLAGETDSTIQIADIEKLDIDGFEFVQGKTVENGVESTVAITETTIEVGGKRLIRLYYDRMESDLAWGTPTNGSYSNASYTEAGRYKVGMPIQMPTVRPDEGYAFEGFYTNAAFTGDPVDINAVFMHATNVTYYPKIVEQDLIQYTVEHYKQNTNDDDYALEEIKRLTGRTGSSVTASAISYQHFTENKTHPSRVSEGIVQGDSSLVLKLYYDLDKFMATFVSDGTTIGTPTHYKYGETITIPDTPTKQGYIFGGWEYNGAVTNTFTMAGQDMIFTATWQEETETSVTMTFDSGVAPIVAEPGASITAPSAPVKTGYTFEGWLRNGMAYSIPTTMPNENITLTADFEPISYTINLYMPYASDSFVSPFKDGWMPQDEIGPVRTIEMTYDEAKTLPTMKGYVDMTGYTDTETVDEFKGWAVAPNLEDISYPLIVAYENGAQVNNLTSTDGDIIWLVEVFELNERARKLTYEYNPERDTLIYDYLPGHEFRSVADVDMDVYNEISSVSGYTFNGFKVDGEFVTYPYVMPNKDVTFTADFTANTHTISYNLDGGTNHGDNPTQYSAEGTDITLSAPTKEKHDFMGWYDSENKKIEKIFANAGIDYNLTAKWEISNEYAFTISYNTKWSDSGGIIGAAEIKYLREDAPFTLMSEIELKELLRDINNIDTFFANYNFKGWLSPQGYTFEGGAKYPPVDGNAKEVWLEAIWEPK